MLVSSGASARRGSRLLGSPCTRSRAISRGWEEAEMGCSMCAQHRWHPLRLCLRRSTASGARSTTRAARSCCWMTVTPPVVVAPHALRRLRAAGVRERREYYRVPHPPSSLAALSCGRRRRISSTSTSSTSTSTSSSTAEACPVSPAAEALPLPLLAQGKGEKGEGEGGGERTRWLRGWGKSIAMGIMHVYRGVRLHTHAEVFARGSIRGGGLIAPVVVC